MILYKTDCYLYTTLLVKSPAFLKKILESMGTHFTFWRDGFPPARE